MFFEQMEMYVSAGLSVNEALDVIGKAAKKKRADSIQIMRKAVESGQNLSTTLENEVNLPSSVIGLVACGETTGSLAQTLKSCHALLDEQDELIKKVLSSMTYPIVIGIATVGLTIGLVQGIMPQIIPLLSGLHVDLPILTKIVITVSRLLINYGLMGAIGACVLIGALFLVYKKVFLVRQFVHRCLMYVPIIGNLVSQYSLALFFQSFGAMIEAGISSDIAYEKAVSSIYLIPLRNRLEKFAGSLRGGEKIHIIAENMPAYIESIISAGEASGNLGRSLERVASMISKELDYALKRLTALVEPAMMLGMGGMVGSIALSIMMPIYDISKTLQR
ncbi:MAG: type II secretion system F family protein [Candidatus Taylorbacteria bacterium]|nr:type II secretion system F family protein [Candidatus Taylorbacteria bacterium]